MLAVERVDVGLTGLEVLKIEIADEIEPDERDDERRERPG